MASVYDQGDSVTVSGVFTASGVATDPTTLTCTISPPGLTAITYIYGTDAEVVKDSTGNYHVVVDTTPAAGIWWSTWVATGAVIATEQWSFRVRPLSSVTSGTSRSTIRHEIDTHLATVIGSPSATRTATGGSTSTLVDTARTEADDYWNNSWLLISNTTDGAAPEGEESLVSDFVAATDTLTVSPGFTAAVGSGDKYELRRYFSAAMIHSAINLALEDAQYQLRVEAEDESLVVVEDTYNYTMPAAVEHVLRIALLEHEVEYRGTATAGAASTLTDSTRSWTTDALSGYEVAIYEGTGAGQYRTISSNTGTVLTVSASWWINPDATSKYVVKDVTEPGYRHRVTHARVVGSNLFLNEYLPRGQRLVIAYVPVHSDLEVDSDRTQVPKAYIVMRATQHLMLMAPAVLPETMQSQSQRIHDRLELQVQRYIQMNKRTEVAGTYWNRGGATKPHWYQGGGLSIGTKKEL